MNRVLTALSILFFITIMVEAVVIIKKDRSIEKLTIEIEELKKISHGYISENESIKEVTEEIDSIEKKREELKDDFEKNMSNNLVNNVDSQLLFFTEYIKEYRLGLRKSSGE